MKFDEADIQAQVRTMQIVVVALAAGVIFFGVLTVTVFRDATRPPVAPGPMILGLPLLTALAAVVGALTLIASIVAPRLMVANGLRMIAGGLTLDETRPTSSGQRQVYPAGDVGRLLPLFQAQLIVASAMNEGGALFALLAYMMEGEPLSLAVAGALLAVLLSRFPTVDRVGTWLELHLERLADLRRDGFSTGP